MIRKNTAELIKEKNWKAAQQIAIDMIRAAVRDPLHQGRGQTMTIKEIARRMGNKVTPAAISAWLEGRWNMAHINICRVFRALMPWLMPPWMKIEDAKILVAQQQHRDRKARKSEAAAARKAAGIEPAPEPPAGLPDIGIPIEPAKTQEAPAEWIATEDAPALQPTILSRAAFPTAQEAEARLEASLKDAAETRKAQLASKDEAQKAILKTVWALNDSIVELNKTMTELNRVLAHVSDQMGKMKDPGPIHITDGGALLK